MSDQYTYWRDALNGKFGAIHDSDPQPGFYRRRQFKDGPFVPVAIWQDNGKMIALVNGKPADASEIWTWVCDKPITEVQYNTVMGGGEWSDEPPATRTTNASDDPHEQLTLELADEVEQAEAFLKTPIKTKGQADQAAIWAKRLAGIGKKATDLHKVEKQPHLDSGRAVDDKWRPLKDGAADFSKKLKRHLDTWLREHDHLEQQRLRKAREEEARLQREADEAQAAADKTTDDEAQAAADKAAEDLAKAQEQAKPKNSQAGRTGSKVSLRIFASAEITDFDKLLMALKDREEIRELVQSLANRAAKSGFDLPGMKIKNEKRAA